MQLIQPTIYELMHADFCTYRNLVVASRIEFAQRMIHWNCGRCRCVRCAHTDDTHTSIYWHLPSPSVLSEPGKWCPSRNNRSSLGARSTQMKGKQNKLAENHSLGGTPVRAIYQNALRIFIYLFVGLWQMHRAQPNVIWRPLAISHASCVAEMVLFSPRLHISLGRMCFSTYWEFLKKKLRLTSHTCQLIHARAAARKTANNNIFACCRFSHSRESMRIYSILFYQISVTRWSPKLQIYPRTTFAHSVPSHL